MPKQSSFNLNELIKGIEQFTNTKLAPTLKKLIMRRVIGVFRSSVRDALVAALTEQYDLLADIGEYGAAVQGKDPLALEKYRSLFIEQIKDEILRTRVEDTRIIIEVMDKDLLGFGDDEPKEGPPTSVDFLHYYLNGQIGEVGFISRELYELRRPEHSNLGRFGEGFMITKEDYIKERWEKVINVKFSDIRHPISGQPPFKGFDEAVANFDFSPYIREAVQGAFEDVKTLIG